MQKKDAQFSECYNSGCSCFSRSSLFSLIAVMAMLLSCGTLSAQLIYHQVGAVAYGGYSTMFSDADVVSNGRGYNTTIGADYELQYGHLLFSTGLAFQWRSAGVDVANDSVMYPFDGTYLYDTQNSPFRMNIITEQRSDYHRVGEIQIPALVGGIYGHLYFLGGLKLNIPLFGVSRTYAHFTTQGFYDKYLQPVTSASFHGFVSDYATSVRGPRLKTIPVDLLASFEIGYNFSRTEDMTRAGEKTVSEMRMRLALYADYSIIPQHVNSALSPFFVDASRPYDIDSYEPANIFATDKTLDTYLANFNVGVKFTVLFGNKQKFKCLNCDAAIDANAATGLHRRDNRQTNTTIRTR